MYNFTYDGLRHSLRERVNTVSAHLPAELSNSDAFQRAVDQVEQETQKVIAEMRKL